VPVVEAQRLPLEALADAAARIAASGDLSEALAAIAAAALQAAEADLVVLRVLDDGGELVARAVEPATSPLAAELSGTRAPAERIAAAEPSDAIARFRGAGLLVVPARAGGRIVGGVELARAEPFSDGDDAVAALVAAEVALAVRTLAPGTHAAAVTRRAAWLELAGEALAAGADPRRAARQAVRIAVEATGARGAVLTLDGLPEPAVEHGDATGTAVELPLGEPPFGALRLSFGDAPPPLDELLVLSAFAARAAYALRAAARAEEVEAELARTRALLEVVSEAVSRLSLAHTLETTVERSAELLEVEQVGVYLREDGRLFAAAGRGVAGDHDDVAAALWEALQGPLRARASVQAHVSGRERALTRVRAALHAAGQSSVVAVPLHAHEDSIGLLLAYPGGRELGENALALLTALGAQLAVAVQNARLHERATELGAALSDALDAERAASRQLSALYEISSSFTQTLSLDATLAAVTEAVARQFGADAAAIRVPDERGDQLVTRAVHVADTRLAEAVRTILERPQPQPARWRAPALLDAAGAQRLGGAHALLAPFLEKGSTAALIPIATRTELLAELTLVSLDPAVPVARETLATAQTIAQQAALAIDNARLYQQQKEFAETMQRSLLPRERPAVPGLDVGRVYESAARVDVGGDVYDFLELPDGRLAVVLGDVTGHGIDATADMAMAKFVFRSLAREHPEPSAFLAHANDVVVDEIAAGKFITMAYLTVDGAGEVRCASAGHPQPRLVGPDGAVEPVRCGGLALGIEAPQEYEQVDARLEPGAAVVLYTDGVIESRREGELFGLERLDEALTAAAGRPAQEVADAVLAACRAFAGGDLADDCALVVIRRAQ